MEQNIDKKNNKKFWIGMIIIGVVLMIIGGVCGKIFYSDNSKGKDEYNESFKANEVNSIEVDCEKLNVNISHGLNSIDDVILVNATDIFNDRFKSEVVNGTLKISYKNKKLFKFISLPFNGWNDDEADGTVTISIPEKLFDKVEIDSGIGVNNITGLNVVDFEFDGGIGDNKFEDLIVNGKADFDLGVGKTKIYNSELNNSEIDVGVGNFEFLGKLNGNTDIDSGVGNVKMDIDGYKLDYNINYDQGVGDVEINGIERDSAVIKHNIDIDSGVGDVKLNFNGSEF